MKTGMKVLVGVMLAMGVHQGAMAAPKGGQQGIPVASAADVVGETKVPIGWADFCGRYPAECAVPALEPLPATLDGSTWKLLVQINAKVNRAIEPITDMDHWGVAERWDFAEDGKGDCEDYVLLKRKMLIEAGLPRQALAVTVVRDKKGDGHAVLTVITDRGDFVLDNQVGQVLPWSQTGYRFVKRMSMQHPNRWVSLGAPAGEALATAR